MSKQHEINDVVYVQSYEAYAVIIGVTDTLNLVTRWYNDDGEQFTAIVTQDEIVGEEEISGLS